MKTVTIYTDGKAGFAALKMSPLARRWRGNRSGMTSKRRRIDGAGEWQDSKERPYENSYYLYRRQSWLRRFEKCPHSLAAGAATARG